MLTLMLRNYKLEYGVVCYFPFDAFRYKQIL